MYDVWLSRTQLACVFEEYEGNPSRGIWHSAVFDAASATDAPAGTRYHAKLDERQCKELIEFLKTAGELAFCSRFDGAPSDKVAYRMAINEAQTCWNAADRIRKQIGQR